MMAAARFTNALNPLPLSQGVIGVACACAFMGCHDLDNETVITGELPVWGECEAELMPWDVRFAAMNELPDGSTLLRFQTTGGALDQDDYLYLLFGADVVLTVGVPVDVAQPTDTASGSLATGVIAFNESCPEERGRSGVLVGTVTFDRVDLRGEEIAGRFDVQVVDGRDASVVYSDSLRGEFRFGYQDYPPFRLFF